MALLFLDSCDHYSGAQGERKWTHGAAAGTVNSRTGPQSFGGPFAADLTFGPEYRTLACGVAYNTQAFANYPISFQGVDSCIARLGQYGDGRLIIDCSAGSSSPSTFVLAVNEWYYFEFYCQMTLTSIDSGHYTRAYNMTARVNEAVILTNSFSETVNRALPSSDRGFSSFAFGGSGGGYSTWFDDIYLTDGELLGDTKVAVLYPNGVGASSDWTPTSGANWSNVEEHIPDDDTTVVSAATSGLKDLYNMDDIPASPVIQVLGVQALWCVKKTDAGAATVKGVWKSGLTEIDQSHGNNFIAPNGFYPSNASYLYNKQAERKSIFTGLDWTVGEINALQLGIKRTG